MRTMAACCAAEAGEVFGSNWAAGGIFGSGESGAAVWAYARCIHIGTVANSATSLAHFNRFPLVSMWSLQRSAPREGIHASTLANVPLNHVVVDPFTDEDVDERPAPKAYPHAQ